MGPLYAMSLQSKIEAVIYASEEPVTLAQLIALLSEEVQSELDALAARQAELPLGVSDGAEPAASPAGDSAETVIANAVEETTGSGDTGREEIAPVAEEADSSQTAGSPTESAPAIASATEDGEDTQPADASTEAASVEGPDSAASKRQARERERAIRDYLRRIVDTLIREYAESDRGLEIREVAGGFRFGTKPEYHDAVRGFVKSLKPALKLSLQALETLAVVAYKQPVTAAEISEIRGVDSAGVLGGLLTRKLIQTAGRKQVIGRPMLYKTTKEFLVRFGLRDVQELPSMEEFERMAGELAEQEDLPMEGIDNVIERANARGDAEHIRETNGDEASSDETASPAEEAGQQPGDRDDPAIEDDSRDATPEPEADDDNANVASSPRSEAEPAPAEQEPS